MMKPRISGDVIVAATKRYPGDEGILYVEVKDLNLTEEQLRHLREFQAGRTCPAIGDESYYAWDLNEWAVVWNRQAGKP